MKRVYSTLAAVVLAAGVSVGASADSQVVMATWGGFVGDLFKQSIGEPFTAQTGVKLKEIAGSSRSNYEMVKAQAKHPQIDVITLASTDAKRAYDEGLLEGLDPKVFTNLNVGKDPAVQLDSKGLAAYGPLYVYPYGILYRTDKVSKPITKWADLWNPELKGKVGVSSPKWMLGYFLLAINKIAGGNESNVQPGIDKIKALGDNLVAVLDDDTSQIRAIAQGEVWAVPALASTAQKAIDQGVPAKFVIPEDGAPAGMDVIALVKNAPHPEDAAKFVNYSLSTESLAKTVAGMKLTPTNPAVKLDAEAAKYALSDEDRKRLVFFDDGAIIRDSSKWIEMWDREIASMVAH
jgi:putative spermidine/putrescine transport system substrate-binding protein